MLDVLCVHMNQQGTGTEEENENENEINGENSLQNITLKEYLFCPRSSLLDNILNELHNCNNTKWGGKNNSDIYPELVTNGQMLMKETTVKELNVISQELRCVAGRSWHSSNFAKKLASQLNCPCIWWRKLSSY